VRFQNQNLRADHIPEVHDERTQVKELRPSLPLALVGQTKSERVGILAVPAKIFTHNRLNEGVA
jgi:hypothetical protein